VEVQGVSLGSPLRWSVRAAGASLKGSDWTGDHRQDTGAERELIQGFIRDLIDAIAEVAAAEEAPIHFYLWSRSEMAQLVEACSRASSRLLGALRELLGCRESLEQLIYSCLQEEVDRRYALGWTGRGLVVVASLRWFGQTYHWRRRIGGRDVDLDHVFTQDLFDFKTDLDLRADGGWAATEQESAARHKFEIRSRFHDSLPAPYLRAVWGALPDPDAGDLPADVRSAIRRYNRAAEPNHLREYLRARVHALRWVEERVRFKNPEIAKPVLSVAELQRFSLGIDNAAQAAIDFLRLDQHVKAADWIAQHIVPPASRVAVDQQLHRALQVGEQHGHLLALTLEGWLGGEDAFGEVLGGVGVGIPNRAGGDRAGPATACPHSLQNFAPLGSSVPQARHLSASRRPHSKQNLASPGLSC
jgi:hypothetical protein